eukprot:1147374-Pelagomonas_calceolata.AAC.5
MHSFAVQCMYSPGSFTKAIWQGSRHLELRSDPVHPTVRLAPFPCVYDLNKKGGNMLRHLAFFNKGASFMEGKPHASTAPSELCCNCNSTFRDCHLRCLTQGNYKGIMRGPAAWHPG